MFGPLVPHQERVQNTKSMVEGRRVHGLCKEALLTLSQKSETWTQISMMTETIQST